MKKRTQLNIEIDDELIKALKFMALSKNIKLNALVKQILSEKIKLNIPDEVNRNVLDELEQRLWDAQECGTNSYSNICCQRYCRGGLSMHSFPRCGVYSCVSSPRIRHGS